MNKRELAAYHAKLVEVVCDLVENRHGTLKVGGLPIRLAGRQQRYDVGDPLKEERKRRLGHWLDAPHS